MKLEFKMVRILHQITNISLSLGWTRG